MHALSCLSQVSDKFSREMRHRYNKCKTLNRCCATIFILLASAAAAVWFLFIAAKLEHRVSWSWIRLSIPLWCALGLLFCFILCTARFRPEVAVLSCVRYTLRRCSSHLAFGACARGSKPMTACEPLAVSRCCVAQSLLVWLVALLPPLLVRADGRDLQLKLVLIPFWIMAAYVHLTMFGTSFFELFLRSILLAFPLAELDALTRSCMRSRRYACYCCLPFTAVSSSVRVLSP